MRYLPHSVFLGICLAIGAIGVAAAQATINDCEKIQAADAYNQCLAKFGPSGKNLNVEPPKAGDVKGSPDEAAASGGKASLAPGATVRRMGRHRGGYVRHGHGGGRKRATFTVRRRHH